VLPAAKRSKGTPAEGATGALLPGPTTATTTLQQGLQGLRGAGSEAARQGTPAPAPAPEAAAQAAGPGSAGLPAPRPRQQPGQPEPQAADGQAARPAAAAAPAAAADQPPQLRQARQELAALDQLLAGGAVGAAGRQQALARPSGATAARQQVVAALQAQLPACGESDDMRPGQLQQSLLRPSAGSSQRLAAEAQAGQQQQPPAGALLAVKIRRLAAPLAEAAEAHELLVLQHSALRAQAQGLLGAAQVLAEHGEQMEEDFLDSNEDYQRACDEC
jgi:hypothetical protein